jgi:lysophospholipase L1-like esterase
MRLYAALTVACFVAACGAPSAAHATPPVTTILLAGQSNAGNVAPFLVAAYHPSEVVMAAHGGQPIRKWAAGSEYWNELAPLLRQPLRAFVWWQGESDPQSTTYLADLTDLVARVRQANRSPNLLVVEIRILPLPQGAGATVRAAQEAFVQADTHAVLVSSDGVPAQADGYHLTDAGYRQMAARIVAVLPKQ